MTSAACLPVCQLAPICPLVYGPRLSAPSSRPLDILTASFTTLPRRRACKHYCLLNSRSLLPPPPQCLRLGFIKLPPCSFFNFALTTAYCCTPFASRVELLGIFLSLSSRHYSGSYTVNTAPAIKDSKTQITASEQSPPQRARAHW